MSRCCAGLAPQSSTDRHYTDPMTLGNMRENGVHRLWVSCWCCHHDALLDVGGYPDSVPVPAFGPRMVCTSCGLIGADEDKGRFEKVLGKIAKAKSSGKK